MLNIGRNTALCAMMLWLGTTVGHAADPWREQALKAAERFAETYELLDEALHEVFDHQTAPQFKKAIEDIHHIEKVTEKLRTDIPTQPFPELCQLRNHLLEDLVEIRQDLINLGVTSQPKIVKSWNNMANSYNRDLNRFFRTCPAH